MDSWDVDVHSCHLLLDHVQLPWFHRPNLPGSYVLSSIRLSPPVTSTIEHHLFTGPLTSFFLELLVIALHSSLAAYWTPSDLENSSSNVIYFCPFHIVRMVLIAKILDIPSSSGPHWSEHSNMICLALVALHSIAHSFIELHKPLYHDKDVIYEGD